VPFRFSTGSIAWLFRREYKTIWTNDAPRPIEVYDPNLAALAAAFSHPTRNVWYSEKTDAVGKYNEHYAPLPLLLPRFLFERAEWGVEGFTTQLVYAPPRGRLVYSNQIRVVLVPDLDVSPFGRNTRAIETLLSNELLPVLSEAALYFPRVSLDRLEDVPEARRFLASDRVLTAIAERRENLEWLVRLAALVETGRYIDAGAKRVEPEIWTVLTDDFTKLLVNRALNTAGLTEVQ
jgi:hypothetical protein